MKTHAFTLDSPVLIVGNPCQFTTCAGLYGYVSRLPEDAKDGFWVEMFRNHDAEPSETSRDWPRFNTTTMFHLQPSNLRPLTGKSRLARVARLIAFDKAEKEKEKDDSKLRELMDSFTTPEAIQKRRDEDAAIDAETARIGRVFILPGTIERGDKSQFPAYRDPVTEAISAELMGYAEKGPSKCTVTERARWKQCLDATAATSFWSPRAECRALVKELDLDPMAEHFAGALWKGEASVYAINGTLREAAIRLWNKGAQFLQIQDMEDAQTCWASYKKGEPKGFLISYAFRRKLPTP